MAIIDKPNLHFETSLYTGTGSSLAISSLNFAPDLVWIKGRSGATEHVLTDSVRGVTKELSSNDSGAEETVAQGLTAFGSDGFTVGTDGSYNTSSATYASWNFKAGTAFTNDASATGIGDIDSSGSANTTSGFSIVSWTGTGSSGDQEIVTGLSTELKFVISKPRTTGGATDQWLVYVNGVTDAQDNCLLLNATNALVTGASGGTPNKGATAGNLLIKAGTSTNNNLNNSGTTYIAYCFAEKQGYSKIGSYTGNGSTDGTFVYTGFKPAYLMVKRTDSTSNWNIFDNKRNPYNNPGILIAANNANADASSYPIDFISNGFKARSTLADFNASGGTFIYMAFAENPFVTSTGVPATAR